jgi:O-antigen/teichoic acid export membrane protein
MDQRKKWMDCTACSALSRSRLHQVACSLADQALSVGGMFMVNVALARTESKEEYGMFVLFYSVFTFLAGLHNAAILEPYTVYGSGRYRLHSSAYFRSMAWINVGVGLLLTGALLSLYVLLERFAPGMASRSLLGLAATVSILLWGVFQRRVFYVQRQAVLAAKTSLVFFVAVVCGLRLATKAHVLNSFSAFLVIALGWVAASAGFARRLPFGKSPGAFLQMEPGYRSLHWKYMRWVLATAFVFQLMNQGYYWLVAALVSVKEVAELKAMALLIAPADQVFIALNYLVLPLLAADSATGKMEDMLSTWKRYALGIGALTSAFAVCVCVFGKAVAHLLYSGRYDDAAPLLMMLGLLPLVMGIGHTMNAALKSMEKPKLVFWAYVCSGVVTFLFGVPLIRHSGLRGAVYGMLLSAVAYTATLALALGNACYKTPAKAADPS